MGNKVCGTASSKDVVTDVPTKRAPKKKAVKTVEIDMASNDTYTENLKKSLRDTNGQDTKELEVKIEVTGDPENDDTIETIEQTTEDITDEITLGGGCFWGLEAVFKHLKGIKTVTNGYSGGKLDNPDYERVSDGDTGHAEVCQVTFDPKIISLPIILSVFFTVHDPTTLNKQGSDQGT